MMASHLPQQLSHNSAGRRRHHLRAALLPMWPKPLQTGLTQYRAPAMISRLGRTCMLAKARASRTCQRTRHQAQRLLLQVFKKRMLLQLCALQGRQSKQAWTWCMAESLTS